jgi:hypothetical protein
VIALPRLASAALLFTLPALAQTLNQTLPAVTTRAFTNDRAGVNTQETILTPNVLLTKGLVRKTTIPVIGDARGMEAQPLILPAVKLPDGSIHDVMVLPSMANVVRGVDAHTGAGLWQTAPLGTPIIGSVPTGPRKTKPDGCVGDFPTIDCHAINDHWGVLSTGVIDPDTQIAYMVAWISPDGTPLKGVHSIFAINVATGTIVGTPVSLAGLKNGTQGYGDTMRKQRSSMVMTNVGGKKTIFFAYGTVMETGPAAAGAIIAYDVASNTITGFLPMSQGRGAGIWMGGQGLAADSAGNLYGVTGNGSFDAVTDFGESIFKVSYTPGAGIANSLKVVTWFSPYSDQGRIGMNPTVSDTASPMPAMKVAGVSQPTADMTPVGSAMAISMVGATAKVTQDVNTHAMVTLIFPADAKDAAWNDEDLGSGGCLLIEEFGRLLCSGKDGIGYVVKTDNMGNTQPADFAPDRVKSNCGKLATPPVWLTASPGPVDACPTDTTVLNFMPWGKTRHMHSTPVKYKSPDGTVHIFVAGENSTIHMWKMDPSGALTYEAGSFEVASIESINPPGGMPGSFCSMSTNNWASGSSVLWCSLPYGDGNATITNGRLIAYDPENLITSPANGNKNLKVVWDSQRWAIPYLFNKFMPPIVWDGQVYLPNYNGGVDVYGVP